MAQTLPPAPDPSAPLPRYERKRVSAARLPRPRFQATDAVLTALFGAASLAFSVSLHSKHTEALLAASLSALIAGLTFLLGWRCGGRTCGIIAGGLTAFSLSFAQASVYSDTALFTVLVMAALFAFACEASLIACALAGVAAAARLDGALLGLILVVMMGMRTRRQFLPGLGVFLGAAIAAGCVRMFGLHLLFPPQALFASAADISWLLQPAQSLTLWLLVPLCAELTDPARRLRWLPTVLWGALYLALTAVVHFGGTNDTLLPLIPIVFVLAGGGLGRLMPSLAGELPAARHGLATLAILGLLLLRGHAEWSRHTLATQLAPVVAAPIPQPLPVAPTPVVIPQKALVPAAAPAPAKVTRAVKHTPSIAARGPFAVRPAAKKPVMTPPVPLYMLRNGYLVHRTKWAIQWDLAHPKVK